MFKAMSLEGWSRLNRWIHLNDTRGGTKPGKYWNCLIAPDFEFDFQVIPIERKLIESLIDCPTKQLLRDIDCKKSLRHLARQPA